MVPDMHAKFHNQPFISMCVCFVYFQNVMKDVINDQAWCRKNANSDNLSDNIGLCVQHASSKACTNVLGVRIYE